MPQAHEPTPPPSATPPSEAGDGAPVERHYRPRVKLWVEHGDDLSLSDWRVRLLETVESTGSLAAAARQLNVPYRTAWYKLRQIEDSLGRKLLETHSGGAEGGRSRLTPEARALIDAFHEFTRGIETLVEARFREHFDGLFDPLREP